jgi:nitrite reductase/ring-hydroxylating ferredoxin subunit
MTLIRVCRVEDLQPGQVAVVPYQRRGIAVFNVKGDLYALHNSCPHQGGPLALGTLTGTTVQPGPYEVGWVRDGEILRCPWHRWEIDVACGTTLTEPIQKIPTYPVVVKEGEVFVEVRERSVA